MVNVAILGFGIVGSGVYEVIGRNASKISVKAASDIRVKYILDVRDFPNEPFSNLLVKDFGIIENDPEIQVVVETIGGAGAALDFTRRALQAGKNVVTSNKELVAKHGYELLKLASEKNLNYLFEASVGGGIPIIRPMSQCLAANELNEVAGILNGTTNYILTRMIKEGLAFGDALKEAQQKGYAEADPTADIEGHDACRKICILSSLAFGRHIYPEQVSTEGITKITAADVRYAGSAGRAIKLLGRAVMMPDGKIAAYVAPHMISGDNPLHNVEGVFNGIVVRGNAIGEVMFYGPGAGKLPTASAVVADIIDAAKHFEKRKYLDWAPGGDDTTADPGVLSMAYYIRTAGGREFAAECFGLVKPLFDEEAPEGEFAFITEALSGESMAAGIKKLGEKCEILSLVRLLD